MDGHTDKSDFIGCCPTNVERPAYFLKKKSSRTVSESWTQFWLRTTPVHWHFTKLVFSVEFPFVIEMHT